MDYLSVAEARTAPGLKLVLSAHVPGPWGEAAKAVLSARGVAFTPVAQAPLDANAELQAWTGIRNAPIVVPESGPPVSGWLDIVMLAEQLGSGPSLLPEGSADRALCIGLSAEICAPFGFGWSRRLVMFQDSLRPDAPDSIQAIRRQYGYSPEAATAASGRMLDIIAHLSQRLRRQEEAGSPYLVGERLSACDLHWACFSMMVVPLSPEDAPLLSPELRARYGSIDQATAASLQPYLLRHRDFIFHNHIALPLDF
jgi:glutathione S-transferase